MRFMLGLHLRVSVLSFFSRGILLILRTRTIWWNTTNAKQLWRHSTSWAYLVELRSSRHIGYSCSSTDAIEVVHYASIWQWHIISDVKLCRTKSIRRSTNTPTESGSSCAARPWSTASTGSGKLPEAVRTVCEGAAYVPVHHGSFHRSWKSESPYVHDKSVSCLCSIYDHCSWTWLFYRYKTLTLAFIRKTLAFETLEEARTFLVEHKVGPFFTNPNSRDEEKILDCKPAYAEFSRTFEEKYRKVIIKGAIWAEQVTVFPPLHSFIWSSLFYLFIPYSVYSSLTHSPS